MRTIATFALLCACLTTCSASPVENQLVERAVDWELAKTTTIQFRELVNLCFDGVRYIVNHDEGSYSFIISEKVIQTQSFFHQIFVIVLDHINERNLTCGDVRFYAQEVIGNALDLVRYLFGADLSEKSKTKIRSLWNPTYTDSEALANHVALVLGCPIPH